MKEILIISAVWCPSCLIVNKNIKKLKKEFPNLNIIKLDYDLDEEEIEKYKIGKILPVLILKEKNIEKDRLIGEKTYEEIKEFLKERGFI